MSENLMTELETMQIKAQDALSSLYDHPAVLHNDFNQNLYFSIHRVCKRGYEESCKKHMQIHLSDRMVKKYGLYEKFKDEFDKELEELKNDRDETSFKLRKHFVSLWKTYEQVFGEPWVFDHVEFWAEVNFAVFVGDTKKSGAWAQPGNWQNYQGFEFGARTYEETVIKSVARFKKLFGALSDNDFLTSKEKKNHKKERMFLHTPVKGGTRLDHNPKFIEVNDAEVNRRWLKWFSKTDYAKKNWKDIYKDAEKGYN